MTETAATCSNCSWRYAGPDLAEQVRRHRLIHPRGITDDTHTHTQEPEVRVSAHELTQTRICEAPGCEEDADVGSFCFFHARSQPGRPPVDQPGKEGTVVETAQAGACKIEGCTKPRAVNVGIYAGLCEEHRTATRGGATNGTADGAVGALKQLMALAKKVDRAKAKAAKAIVTARDAKRDADAAEAEYQQAVRQAMGAAGN